jgi:hypothetical protein
MNVFISHNSRDKAQARLLATLLTQQGVNVWFDEWNIRPGDSLTGGIEEGLGNADVFVLLWSRGAQQSNWVGTEMRAYIRQRVDNDGLRIVPLMLDDTPLPILVADYRGFDLSTGERDMEDVVVELTGNRTDREVAALLQRRLNEITRGSFNTDGRFGVLVCPGCGSDNFKHSEAVDYDRDDIYYMIECQDCGWGDWTQ